MNTFHVEVRQIENGYIVREVCPSKTEAGWKHWVSGDTPEAIGSLIKTLAAQYKFKSSQSFGTEASYVGMAEVMTARNSVGQPAYDTSGHQHQLHDEGAF